MFGVIFQIMQNSIDCAEFTHTPKYIFQPYSSLLFRFLAKLKYDFEEAHLQHESTYNMLRKKHAESISEMNEQIEEIQKF